MTIEITKKIKNSYKIIRINKENNIKYEIKLIKKIDTLLYNINNELKKIQTSNYGRVEIYYKDNEVLFKIWQKLSYNKINIESGYKLRHYSLCNKNILQRLKNKPDYINNKEIITKLIRNAQKLIKIRNELVKDKNYNNINKVIGEL